MTDNYDTENLDQGFESEIHQPTNKYPQLEESWITKMQRYQPQAHVQPDFAEESQNQDISPQIPQQNDQYFDLLNFSGKDLSAYKADTHNQDYSSDLPDEKPLVRGQSLEEFTDLDFGPRRALEPKIEEKPASTSQKVENQTFPELKLQESELSNNDDEFKECNSAGLSQDNRMNNSNLFPESLDSQPPVHNNERNSPKTEERTNKWGVLRRDDSDPVPKKTEFKKPEFDLADLGEMVDSVMVPQAKMSQPDRITASQLFPESLDEPTEIAVEPKMTKWGVVRQDSNNAQTQNKWSPEGSKKYGGISQLSFGTEMGRDSDKSSEKQNKYVEELPKKEIEVWDERLENLEEDNDKDYKDYRDYKDYKDERDERDERDEDEYKEEKEETQENKDYGMRIDQGELLLEKQDKYESQKEEEKEEEEEEENIEVVEEEEEVKKVEVFAVTEEVFADENMLYPMMNSIRQNLLKISQTMGTQTNDLESSRRLQNMVSSNYEITIPEEKIIKDGYYYTYVLYKIVTKIYEDEKKEYSVHRRYNDFKILFEILEKKYKGYVIPLLPPKNFLTTINKESSEFSETRRKELIDFLKKCMQHPFLQTTEEMFIFLTDDKGFHSFIKKEQQADAHHKNFDIWTIWDKVSQVASKVTSRKPIHREMTPLDNELYNHESSLVSLQARLESVYKYMLQYLVLKRKNISNLIFFTRKLQTLAEKKRGDALDDLKKSLKNSTISSVEDKLIRDLTDLAENQLKGIIKTVEAMIYSLQKRNTVIEELHELLALIEEQDLNVKKNLATQEQLDDLRKQYDVLKEKFQKLSETLLSEVEYFRENITNELARFAQTVYENNEKSLNEALQLWLIEKPLH